MNNMTITRVARCVLVVDGSGFLPIVFASACERLSGRRQKNPS